MQPVNDLKARTKTYALNIIKLVKSMPEDRIGRVLGNKFYGQVLPLRLITGLRVKQDKKAILFQRLLLWKKKRMKLHFGWN